jgi:hypothetical protein
MILEGFQNFRGGGLSTQKPSLGMPLNRITPHPRTLTEQLLWSRGSVLPLSTQVRGFKPGRSRQDFSGPKNPEHAFLRKGSKAVGPTS